MKVKAQRLREWVMLRKGEKPVLDHLQTPVGMAKRGMNGGQRGGNRRKMSKKIK